MGTRTFARSPRLMPGLPSQLPADRTRLGHLESATRATALGCHSHRLRGRHVIHSALLGSTSAFAKSESLSSSNDALTTGFAVREIEFVLSLRLFMLKSSGCALSSNSSFVRKCTVETMPLNVSPPDRSPRTFLRPASTVKQRRIGICPDGHHTRQPGQRRNVVCKHDRYRRCMSPHYLLRLNPPCPAIHGRADACSTQAAATVGHRSGATIAGSCRPAAVCTPCWR